MLVRKNSFDYDGELVVQTAATNNSFRSLQRRERRRLKNQVRRKRIPEEKLMKNKAEGDANSNSDRGSNAGKKEEEAKQEMPFEVA